MCTPGNPSWPHACESITQEMKRAEVQAAICARHVLCVMGIVCRVLWVQRPWWLGGEGWASLCITCPLEVRLDSKVMQPLKETCYEIHGWNKSGANMCALVEECLVLHCEPCVMAHILESCLDSTAAPSEGALLRCCCPPQNWGTVSINTSKYYACFGLQTSTTMVEEGLGEIIVHFNNNFDNLLATKKIIISIYKYN